MADNFTHFKPVRIWQGLPIKYMTTFSNIPRLGIKAIDDEHKDIMLFLIQLKETDTDKQKITQAFLDYSANHYEHEELYMARQNYPMDESHVHIMEHRRLASVIKKLVEKDGGILVQESIQKIKVEFLTHIAIYDKMWAEWVEMNSPGFRNPHY